MINKIIDWIKQKRRERRRLLNTEYWGYAGPGLLPHAPYRTEVKTIRIKRDGKIFYCYSERDEMRLDCDKVDAQCWTGCPHYKNAMFFQLFNARFTFQCRYYPTRIDAERVEGFQYEAKGVSHD